MEINKINPNINFGQLVPTEALLKSALKIHNFREGKSLTLAVDKSFPGSVGYFNKAINIAKIIQSKQKMKPFARFFCHSDEMFLFLQIKRNR